MKELRFKVGVDDSGTLSYLGKLKASVGQLAKPGLASGFVDSFKKFGSKSTFAGILDGLEATTRGLQRAAAARKSLGQIRAVHTGDVAALKQMAADLRGKIATPKSGLVLAKDAAAQLKPVARELDGLKTKLAALQSTRLKFAGADARVTAATKARDAAIAAVNAGRDPRTGQFTGALSATKMGQLLKPFVKDLQLAQQHSAKLHQTLSQIGKVTYAFAQAKSHLKQMADALRGRTGNQIITPQAAAQRMKPLAAQAQSSAAGLGAAGAEAWAGIRAMAVGILGIVGSLALGVGRLLLGAVSAVVSAVKAALSAIGSLLSAALHGFTKLALAAAATGAAITAALAAGLKKAVDLAGEMINLKARTGIEPGAGLLLKTASELVGESTEKTATEINRLQKALSNIGPTGADTRQALLALGLSLTELRQLTPLEQFEAISAKIRAMKNPMDQAAVAFKLFTARGADMLTMIKQSYLFDIARQQWGKTRDLLAGMADQLNFVRIAWEGLLHIKPLQFFVGLAAGMAKPLAFFADKINKLDFTGLGVRLSKKLGDAATVLYNIIVDGQLGDFLAKSVSAAFRSAGNVLVAAVRAAGATLHELLQIPGLFKALGDGIAGAFKFGVGVFLQAFQDILPDIVGGLGKALGLADYYASPARRAQDLPDTINATAAEKAAALENEKQFKIKEAMAKGEATYKWGVGPLADRPAATPAALAESRAEETRLRGLATQAQANIDARRNQYATQFSDQMQAWMKRQTAPANIESLQSSGGALMKGSGKALAGMKENFKDLGATAATAFKETLGKDPFQAADALAKVQELIAAARNKGLPDTVIPKMEAGNLTQDPYLKFYPRVTEAASSLEKSGATFNRDKTFGHFTMADLTGQATELSPAFRRLGEDRGLGLHGGAPNIQRLGGQRPGGSYQALGQRALPVPAGLVEAPRVLEAWAHAKTVGDTKTDFAAGLGKTRAGAMPLAGAGMGPQRDPTAYLGRIAQNTFQMQKTLQSIDKKLTPGGQAQPAAPAVGRN